MQIQKITDFKPKQALTPVGRVEKQGNVVSVSVPNRIVLPHGTMILISANHRIRAAQTDLLIVKGSQECLDKGLVLLANSVLPGTEEDINIAILNSTDQQAVIPEGTVIATFNAVEVKAQSFATDSDKTDEGDNDDEL
jgi:hypothetical protein